MAKVISGRGPTPPIDPPVLPPVIIPPKTKGLVFPEGKVRAKTPWDGLSFDIPWTNASRWEPWFTEAARPSVPAKLLASIAVLESNANQYTTFETKGTRAQVITVGDRFGDGPSVGIMQVKPQLWQKIAPQHDLYTPKGNIFLAALLLEQFIEEHGSWQAAIKKEYHPGTSAAGVTPQKYVDSITALMAEIDSASAPIVINPPKPLEPMEAVFGKGNFPKIHFGFLEVGGVGYPYGVGHGTTHESQHTGADINVPYGTKFYAPAAGKILCVGTAGQGVWGQVCGFFSDTGDAGPGSRSLGVGNITLLCDSGHKIVFGHSRTCNFKPGDRVKAGDWLGTTGGMLGPHMHLEVAVEKNGTYWIINPLPAIRLAMGQQPATGVIEPIKGIIWEGTSNFHDRSGQRPVAIFHHVTDDLNFSNVKSWFQNRTSRASAHWVIDIDGDKHQFVGSAKSAWTNGEIRNPRTDIRWMNEAIRSGRNFNDFTLNIEVIGKPGRAFDPRQIDSVIDIDKYYIATYGIPVNRGHMNRHADVDSVNRRYCPGDTFPLAEIIQECGGDPLILNP